MYERLLALCAMLVLTFVAAFADVGGPATPPFLGYEDTFQVSYFPNLLTNDGVLNLMNSGVYEGTFPYATGRAYICANIYVYAGRPPGDPQGEALKACCTCPISANGSASVRARQLLSNTITNGPFNFVNLKVIWTVPANDNPANCNAAAIPPGNVLCAPAPEGGAIPVCNGFATGGRCWTTHWHAALGNTPLPPPVGVGGATPPFGSETQCKYSPLSANERTKNSTLCNFLRGIGSGAGVCPDCPTGGPQGAASNPR